MGITSGCHLEADEILDGKPSGATHFAVISKNKVAYFMETKKGFRQVKDNLISFRDSGVNKSDILKLPLREN